MKRIVSGLAAALLGVVLVHAEVGQDAVLSAQQKFVDAYRTCNVTELNKLVTDDMQFIHVGGTTQDKTTFVAGVGQCALADLKMEVTKVRMYGDTAVIQGNFHYQTKQGPGGILIVSEVFVRRDGAWMFASHQSTAPAQPAATTSRK